ncbi:hypothetical protein IRJ41_005219 [Triplophysa rosa]|uniref:Uncharacterized protein n=1 Tax=Triplophysa rosa TaxID=992332 RepID=A0A9W7T6Q0_TRIRA|nr:hypothetical protein IRJ41_005219 [Triplophysa rosa]
MAGINAHAEPRQPLTAAHLGTRAVASSVERNFAPPASRGRVDVNRTKRRRVTSVDGSRKILVPFASFYTVK